MGAAARGFLADDREGTEAVTTIDVLVRDGIKVTTASVASDGNLAITCSRGVKLLADERSTLPATKKAARCGCTREQVWKRIFCAAIVKETFAKTHRCKPAKKSSPN